MAHTRSLFCCGWALVCLLATPVRLGAQYPTQVDCDQSRAYVRVGKTGLGHEHGAVGKLRRGYLRLNTGSDAGLLEFDMGSFVADTKESRQYVGLVGETDAVTARQVTDNMRSAEVLDVAHYPTSTYVVKSALPAEKQHNPQAMQYVLDGDFTLHGVTKPLKLLAEAQVTQRGWRVVTRFAILQSSFGITPYTRAFGAVGVADRLDLWGDVLLTVQPQAQQPAAAPRR